MPGLTPAGFAERVSSLDYAAPGARRITVAIALPEGYAADEPAYDAVVELTFSTGDAFAGARGDIEAIVDGLKDAIDRDGSAGFLAEELRLIWPEQAEIGA
jgi:hypothetical protein